MSRPYFTSPRFAIVTLPLCVLMLFFLLGRHALVHALAVRTAATYYVSPSGSDTSPGTLSAPKATIQAAVNVAAGGDTVIVEDGTYSGTGNRDIDFGGKNLTVQSQNGPATTIIDCGGLPSNDGSSDHRGFYFHSGESSAAVAGLTIENGYVNLASGGGIKISNGSAATLTNCTLTGNTAYSNGGGGLYNAGVVTLANCTLTGNAATNGGGGGLNNYFGTATLTSCTVAGNSATSGGGLANVCGAFTATNCTITGNSASFYGPGLFYNSTYGGTTTLTNDILYGDSGVEVYGSATATYCDVQGGYTGSGNINADPLFVSAPLNLHLQPDSPCTGAGTSSGAPATDKDGVTRANPPTIGAYEGKKRAATTTTVASTRNPSNLSQSVTFTATVMGSSPTGAITFTDTTSSTTLGTGTVSGGTATLGTSTLTIGSHQITAAYGGDGVNRPSISAALAQQVNGPPTANPDHYSTTENKYIDVSNSNGVLANDTDPQHSALTVTLPNGAYTAHGVLSFSLVTGGFRYTPNTGFVGTDTFAYYVTDAAGLTSNTTTVTIDVAPAPATHFTVTAPSSVNAGAPFSITVAAQDDSGGAVAGYSGAVHFTSSDYQAVLPADATLTNGVGTFMVRMHLVGSQTITAYQTTNYDVTGTTGNISVTQGTPTTRSVPGQYATIQAAIDASIDGDTVLVGDGTYSGAGNRDLDFHSLSLTVQSQNGPTKTLIDCGGFASSDGSGDHRGFYLHTGESNPAVSGFTIKNGYESGSNSSNGNGGAVDIENSNNVFPSVALTNCILTANYASNNGGGVAVAGGTLTLTGCTLAGNSTGYNGGGLSNSGSATLTDCVFDSNAASYGAGVCNGSGAPTGPSDNFIFTASASLAGCTFTHNTASFSGGALYNGGGSLTLDRCSLSGNSASDGGALSNANSVFSPFGTTSGQAALTDCVLTGNTATSNGGAILNGYPASFFSFFGGFVTLTNSLLTGNAATTGNGGALYTNGSSTLTGCSLTANAATSGGGIYSDTQASVSLTNDILYGDTANEITDNNNAQNGGPLNNVNATYCDIGEASGIGDFSDYGSNINRDPLFVGAPSNLHLLSGSPCIGAGTHNGASATDLGGVARPDPPSIGAYEGKNKVATTTSVSSSLNPSVSGQRVTFTATVSGAGGTPTGLVTFKEGPTVIGSSGLSGSGSAAITTAALGQGTHYITANYGGDTVYGTSVSPVLTQMVNQVRTSVTVISSVSPSVFGQSITLTATVAPVSPGTGTPTGTVTFSENGATLRTVNLANGVAAYTTAALSFGSHTITATFAPPSTSQSYGPSSGMVTQTVKQAATTTALTVSSGTFTATVTPTAPGAGTPTGTVSFTLDNGTPSVHPLTGGKATYTLIDTAVSHTVVATYSGDTNFAVSTSPTVMQAGGKDTTTTLTSRVNPAALNQPILLTATVTGNGGTPAGSVTFTIDGSPLAPPAQLNMGQATTTVNGLSLGSHTVVASYSGNTASIPSFNSSSASLTETVGSLTDVTTYVTVAYGSLTHFGATYTQAVTLTNATGAPIAGPVSLVLVGLPSNVTLTGTGTIGTTTGGYPYLTILGGGNLPTGATNLVLKFNNPSGARISFNLRVLSGSPANDYQP